MNRLFGSKVRETVYAAMGFDPQADGIGEWAQVGTFEAVTDPVILDALVAEWVKRVRRVIALDPATVRANERHLIPEFAALDVLTFTEYRYACATGRELVNRYDPTNTNRGIELLYAERDAITAEYDAEQAYEAERQAAHEADAEQQWKRYNARLQAASLEGNYLDDVEWQRVEDAEERKDNERATLARQYDHLDRQKQQHRAELRYIENQYDPYDQENTYVDEWRNDLARARKGNQLAAIDSRRDALDQKAERLNQREQPKTGRGDLVRARAALIPPPAPAPFISQLNKISTAYESRLKRIDLKLSHAYQDLEIPHDRHRERLFARLFGCFHFSPSRTDYCTYLEHACHTLWRALQHDFFRTLPTLIPAADTWAHTYLTGKSGSGKSELLKVLIQHFLHQSSPPSIVVIDPKGDFAGQVATWHELAASDRLIYIDPALSPEYLPCINPFDIPAHTETEVGQLRAALSSVLVEIISRSGKSSDLSINMETVFKSCIAVLIRMGGKTLLDLLTFLDDESNAEYVAAGKRSPNPVEREFFERDFTADGFASTKRALRTKLQSILGDTTLQRLIVGKSTIDLEKAVNGGKVVIFSLSKGGAGEDVTSIFGTFIVALLQVIAQRRYRTPEEFRKRCFLIIDECQNFLTTSIDTLLSESGRSFRVHLVLAQQFIGQGYRGEAMNANLKANILQNTAVKITGKGDVQQLDAMAATVRAPADELATLKTGVFYVKSSLPRSVRFRIPTTYLGSSHCVPAEERKAMHARQIERYYRKVGTDSSAQRPTEAEATRNARKAHADSAYKPPRRDRPSRT